MSTSESDELLSAEDSVSNDGDGDITKRIVLHVYDDESKEFTSLTTYHGMIRIYTSETWPSRIFWSLVVVTCLTLFMIHSGMMLTFYRSHPSFLKRMDLPLSHEYLPAITICRLEEDYKIKEYNAIRSFIGDEPLSTYSLAELKSISSKSVTDFLETAKPECSDLIISLRIGGEIVSNPCDAAKYRMTQLGYCLTLSNWREISGARPDSGIEIRLRRKIHDKILYRIHNKDSNLRMKSNGRHVAEGKVNRIHVVPRKMKFPIPVAAGTHPSAYCETAETNIYLFNFDGWLEWTTNTNGDWGTCTDEWDAPHREGEHYDSQRCEDNCIAMHYAEKCGCAPFYYASNFSKIESCSLNQMIACKPRGSQLSDCKCSIECERLVFDVQSPTNMKADDPNISILHITFPQKIITETQTKRIKAVDLLSYVAGSMGLFLGMSCVTLLEVFIYLFKSIWGAFNDERHKYYFDNIIGENDETRSHEDRRSYEQIVITTKVHGNNRIEEEEDEDDNDENVVERNYAITTDWDTKRKSLYRMGPRSSIASVSTRSRSNTATTSELNPTPALRIQLARPPQGRRKSIYSNFGNF